MKKKPGALPAAGFNCSRPLMLEALPPLTRLMTFCSVAVAVLNTADSPFPMLNVSKL